MMRESKLTKDGEVILMDGGFPMDLVEKVDSHPLWIDSYNVTNPELVIQNHIAYLKAGSKLLKTNSYQSTVEGYMENMKMTKEEANKLIMDTVKLCRDAIALYYKQNQHVPVENIFVVGAIGTYGAHLHDGSDYTGNFAEKVSKEDIKSFHREQINALLQGNVDALAFETIPCQMEGEAIAELLSEEFPAVNAWISFQCKDALNLAHGESFKEVASSCWNITNGNLLALGMNCIDPRNVTSLAKSLNEGRENKIPLVLYPNSGETYNPQNGWQEKDRCQNIEKDVMTWLNLGAKFIGGCCRTTPQDIINIGQAIMKWKQTNRN